MSQHPAGRRIGSRSTRALLGVLTSLLVTACAGGGAGSPAATASEGEWRQLRAPRPAPLDGAPAVTLSEVQFLGDYPWSPAGRVSAEIGVAELAVAGLLRRRDVLFVERRRFAAAAAAERQGLPRPPGRPPVGVSPSARLSATAVWIPLADRAALEIRLTFLESGSVAGATRTTLPADAGPLALARGIVEGVLQVLDEVAGRPAWDDALAEETNVASASGVSTQAVESFMLGLAAEERWDWEGARRGYQAAAADAGFHEARTALARAARLRLGGTLGES